VARSVVLLPVLALAVSVGICFIGTYLVLLPLLVRDHYGGGGASMGVLLAMLPAGGIAAGSVIFARGGLRRNGGPLLVGQAAAALCILGLASGPPFPAAALYVLGWGLASAFFMNAGRTLFQQHATPENRGRVLSLYALGFMGPGLVGSLLAGVLADAFGVHAALAALAIAMLSCVAAVAATTRVARL
jgi:MFS family permease